MDNGNSHNEDWKKEAPVLASLQNSAQNEAPEGYFETLPAQILSKINQDAQGPTQIQKRNTRILIFRPAVLAMAATFVGILFITLRLMPDKVVKVEVSLQAELSSISSDALLAELFDQDVQEEELSFALVDLKPEKQPPSEAVTKEEIPEKEMIDFLDEESLDDLDLEALLN